MRQRAIAGAVGLIALIAAPSAFGTLLPEMLYSPPRLEVRDYKAHMSIENIIAGRLGPDIGVTNSPSPLALDPESDPGCDAIVGGYKCPVAGIDQLVVTLGDMDDTALINLGSHAGKVPTQIVRGGAGGDGLRGKAGKQRLLGGGGDDTLGGGPGRDVLIGGRGDDTCRGGPGKDVIKSCE